MSCKCCSILTAAPTAHSDGNSSGTEAEGFLSFELCVFLDASVGGRCSHACLWWAFNLLAVPSQLFSVAVFSASSQMITNSHQSLDHSFTSRNAAKTCVETNPNFVILSHLLAASFA